MVDIAFLDDNGICINIGVFESVEAANHFTSPYMLVPIEPGYGTGDCYTDGKWSKVYSAESPTARREKAYETLIVKKDGSPLLLWENQSLTIDQANKKWLDYAAEGNAVADQLQTLISTAKQYIREMMPDYS